MDSKNKNCSQKKENVDIKHSNMGGNLANKTCHVGSFLSLTNSHKWLFVESGTLTLPPCARFVGYPVTLQHYNGFTTIFIVSMLIYKAFVS